MELKRLINDVDKLLTTAFTSGLVSKIDVVTDSVNLCVYSMIWWILVKYYKPDHTD